MLYEATTYKDIDDFNQDAQSRYSHAMAIGSGGNIGPYWKLLHLNVQPKGHIFVLWVREQPATLAS
jgi:hypothetical protein